MHITKWSTATLSTINERKSYSVVLILLTSQSASQNVCDKVPCYASTLTI